MSPLKRKHISFQLFFFFEITELTASLECVFGQSSGIKRQAETSSVKWAETEGFCAKDIIVSLAKNSDKKKIFSTDSHIHMQPFFCGL